MDTATAPFEDLYWTSADGLKLHCRDYAGSDDRAPLICLPGLTRNARDFAGLAEWIAPSRRVLCIEFRGRGDSDYAKDTDSYAPPVYAADVLALLEDQGIGQVVSIGTSLGGIVTALIAASRRDAIAGAVINDIGPVIETSGVDRIRDYVGGGGSWPTWTHAARALRDLHGAAFPQVDLAGWIAFAKRTMAVGHNGRIAYDYDMKIAEPFRRPDGAAPVDLWPAFEALGGRPTLLLRGALSDLLSVETARAMASRLDGLELVEVPEVGHAPTLDEPISRDAIARLLERSA